jgi:hypothetical protein
LHGRIERLGGDPRWPPKREYNLGPATAPQKGPDVDTDIQDYIAALDAAAGQPSDPVTKRTKSGRQGRKKAPPRTSSHAQLTTKGTPPKRRKQDSPPKKKSRTRPDPLAAVPEEQLDGIAARIAAVMEASDSTRDRERARSDHTEYEKIGELVLELFDGDLDAYQSQAAGKAISLRRIAARPALVGVRSSKSRLQRSMAAITVSRELRRTGTVPDPGQYFSADDLACLYKLRDNAEDMVALARLAAEEDWPKTRLHEEVCARRPSPAKTGQPLRGALHEDARLLARFAKAIQDRPLDDRAPPDTAVYAPDELARLRSAHEALMAWGAVVVRELARLDKQVPVGIVLEKEAE